MNHTARPIRRLICFFFFRLILSGMLRVCNCRVSHQVEVKNEGEVNQRVPILYFVFVCVQILEIGSSVCKSSLARTHEPFAQIHLWKPSLRSSLLGRIDERGNYPWHMPERMSFGFSQSSFQEFIVFILGRVHVPKALLQTSDLDTLPESAIHKTTCSLDFPILVLTKDSTLKTASLFKISVSRCGTQ